MREVQVVEKEPNGLATTLKALVDANIDNPSVWNSIKDLDGTLVVMEKQSHVAATLFFKRGQLEVRNGAISKPSAYLAAGFEELAEVSSGQVGPIRALLTGKIRAGGNLLKLLRMSKALISQETD